MLKLSTVEIICPDNEMLSGALSSDFPKYISDSLDRIGIEPLFITTVPSTYDDFKHALDVALARVDTVITVTPQSLCSDIVSISDGEFGSHSDKIPLGKEILHGAYACRDDLNNKLFVSVPPLDEAHFHLFSAYVIPFISDQTVFCYFTHILRFFGVDKDIVDSEAKAVVESVPGLSYSSYESAGEVMVKIKSTRPVCTEAFGFAQYGLNLVKELPVSKYMYGCSYDCQSLEDALVKKLKSKKLTLSCAESCTGGLLSKAITDVPGASSVFSGSVVSYTDEIKAGLLGVKNETLQEFTAISGEVALEMAKGVRLLTGTHIGISVTGNAGPCASCQKENGLVFIAIASESNSVILKLNLEGNRNEIRTLAMKHAFSQCLNFIDDMDILKNI